MGRTHRIALDRLGPLRWRWRLHCAESKTDRMEAVEEGHALRRSSAERAAMKAARQHVTDGDVAFRVIQQNGESATIEARTLDAGGDGR